MPQELVAAYIFRSAQLLGVAPDDLVNKYLLPPRAVGPADSENVRNWPTWSLEEGRNEMALAEQVWIDTASVNAAITDSLEAALEIDDVIRVTWNLILIGQLHRLALVLHHGPYSSSCGAPLSFTTDIN